MMTRDGVAVRVRESWDTLRRVPAHGIPGYRTMWPEPVHDFFEAYGTDAPRVRLAPAHPRAIDRMNETFGWFVFLDGKKHLAVAMWMTCGRGMGPYRAGAILGVHRHTVRKRKDEALGLIVDGLHRQEIANGQMFRQYTFSPIRLGSMRVV